MSKLHRTGQLLTAAVTAGAGATLESDLGGGSDFASLQADVTSVERIAITVEVTGANAGINGLISVDFIVSVDDTPRYDTVNVLAQVFSTVSCQSTGLVAERSSAVVEVEGFTFIAIGRIRNADLNFSANVQVHYGKYERIE